MSENMRIDTGVDLSLRVDNGGGTANYNDLINKPSINAVVLTGGLQTKDLNLGIPEKTSELINDSEYVDKAYVDNLVGDINGALEGLL